MRAKGDLVGAISPFSCNGAGDVRVTFPALSHSGECKGIVNCLDTGGSQGARTAEPDLPRRYITRQITGSR